MASSFIYELPVTTPVFYPSANCPMHCMQFQLLVYRLAAPRGFHNGQNTHKHSHSLLFLPTTDLFSSRLLLVALSAKHLWYCRKYSMYNYTCTMYYIKIRLRYTYLLKFVTLDLSRISLIQKLGYFKNSLTMTFCEYNYTKLDDIEHMLFLMILTNYQRFFDNEISKQ